MTTTQMGNNSNFDYDFGLLKSEISRLPVQHILDAETLTEMTPQDIVDESFDAFVQDAATDIPCRYYNTLGKINISRNDIVKFLKGRYVVRKLQKENVLLSTDVWNKVVSTRKKTIDRSYFQKFVDYGVFDVSFSTIDSSSKSEKFSTPVLTTIHFDFTNLSEFKNRYYSAKTHKHFEKLFEQYARSNEVDAIYKIASRLEEFSIHKYFLPCGLANMDEACLLYRYDHSYEKHKNGAMPPLYKNVYPEFIDEPHFHFTRGFGSVYKLTSKMEAKEFGCGYAIGISGLKKYLDKLNNQDFKDKKEEELYMQNDFGMPFLRLYTECQASKSTVFGSLVEAVSNLQLVSELQAGGAALAFAYNISDLIFGKKIKFESFKSINYKPFVQDRIDDEGKGRDR